MALYNLTGTVNQTGYLGFIQSINNNILGYKLGILLLLIIFLIALISFVAANFEPKQAFIASTFIVFVLSYILRVAELVTGEVVLFTTIAFALSLGWSFLRN